MSQTLWYTSIFAVGAAALVWAGRYALRALRQRRERRLYSPLTPTEFNALIRAEYGPPPGENEPGEDPRLVLTPDADTALDEHRWRHRVADAEAALDEALIRTGAETYTAASLRDTSSTTTAGRHQSWRIPARYCHDVLRMLAAYADPQLLAELHQERVGPDRHP